MKKIVKNVIKYESVSIATYSLICLFNATISIILSYISGSFIDQLLECRTIDVVRSFCFFVAAIGILQIIVIFIIDNMSVKLRSRLGYKINAKVLDELLRRDFRVLKGNDYTFLTNRVNADCNVLATFILQVFTQIPVNVLFLVVSLAYIFWIKTELAIVIIGVNLLYMVFYQIIKGKLSLVRDEYKDGCSLYYTELNNQLQNIHFIKVHSLYEKAGVVLDKAFTKLYKVLVKNQHYSFVFQCGDSVAYIVSLIFLFIIGGVGIINNDMTVGSFSILATFYSYTIKSVRYFVAFGSSVLESKVAMRRLNEYLSIEKEIYGEKKVIGVSDILVRNLTFGFNNMLFFDRNYHFVKGNIYVIIGENGTGKTTFLDILCGLYVNSIQGKIMFNNVDVRELDMGYMRNCEIEYCLQKNERIQDDVISNNIANTEGFDEEYLYNLCEQLKIENLLNMEDKDFLRGAIDNIISSGALQKLSIARSLVKNTSVLLMDEPTNSIDYESKEILIKELQKRKEEKIIIIVTHDLDLQQIADKVVYF